MTGGVKNLDLEGKLVTSYILLSFNFVQLYFLSRCYIIVGIYSLVIRMVFIKEKIYMK